MQSYCDLPLLVLHLRPEDGDLTPLTFSEKKNASSLALRRYAIRAHDVMRGQLQYRMKIRSGIVEGDAWARKRPERVNGCEENLVVLPESRKSLSRSACGEGAKASFALPCRREPRE